MVLEDDGVLVLGELAQDPIGLVQQRVDEQATQLLERDGEDQTEGELLSQGNHSEPKDGREQYGEQPEERTRKKGRIRLILEYWL